MSITVHRDGEWQQVFIEHLRINGIVGRACEAAHVARQTAYRHYREDELFAAEWDQAIRDAAWTLEDEGWRRARDGVDKPIVANGQIIGTTKEYSNTLLIFLLKHLKPEKFGDKLTVEISTEQAAILARLNLNPAQAWEMLFANLKAELPDEINEDAS